MDFVPSFESAWTAGAEPDLPLSEYSRRRLVHRRQRIVAAARSLGWTFLRVGERLPAAGCLLAGIRLDSRRDLQFLDLLRARKDLWLGREVCLFHVERPYVLPLPSFPADTPAVAQFEGQELVGYRQGIEAFRFVAGDRA